MQQVIRDLIHSSLEADEKTSLLFHLIDNLPIGMVIIHNNRFGGNKKFYELINQNTVFHTVDDYLATCSNDYILYKEFPALLADSTSFTRLYSIQPAADTEYYLENFTYVVTDNRQNTYYVSTLTDQSSMNDLSIQFEEHNKRAHILEELIPDYIFEYDMAKDTLHFPERWKPDGINTDYPHAKKWLKLHEIIHPDEMPFIIDAMTSSRAFKQPRTLEFRAKFLRDDYSWFRVSYKLFRSRATNSLRAIGKIRNIDKEHLLSVNDESPEGVDKHTGLLIPSYMQTCVDQIIQEEPPENLCALMLLQLDNFAEFQKKTGDLYIGKIEKDIAHCLKHSFRTTDVLGYSQEGRFLVFLRKVPEHIMTQRARQVLDSISTIDLGTAELGTLTCSIGIAITPLDGNAYMELFLKADSAMYLSKARGGNTFSFFNIAVDSRQRAE